MSRLSHQTLRRLIYFATIAEAGSIRKAAQGLGLSVPVLSEALSALEDELGVTLAVRSTRHFALTSAGRDVHAKAAEITQIAQTIVAPKTKELCGHLAITLPVEVSTFWLPAILAKFSKAHPKVQVRIEVSDEVHDLRFGPIDLAIRTRYVDAGQHRKGSDAYRLMLIGAPHISAARSAGGLTIDCALIDSRADRTLLPAAPEDGRSTPVRFQNILTINNRMAAIALVKRGLGAAIVIGPSVTSDIESGALVDLAPGYDFGAVALGAVYRDKLPSPEAAAFAALAGISDTARR